MSTQIDRDGDDWELEQFVDAYDPSTDALDAKAAWKFRRWTTSRISALR